LNGVIKKSFSSFLRNFINFILFGSYLKVEIRGQSTNFKNFEGSNCNFRKFEGSICNFWKFIGVNLKFFENLRTKMQILKNYNNEEIWNSLNLIWTKYFINFHNLKNSSNYHPNNRIYLESFEFPQNISPSKYTLRI
jgi:hypothetical protein